MPRTLTYEQAAALPTVCLTVSQAFDDLAELKAGDKVLIHAASGGVGLAAIQHAQRVGAEVYATAGAAAKHEYLRSLGVDNISTSRDAGTFMKDMGHISVDVVLNCLSDDYIPSSLKMLSEGGRFVEIGKRGVWSRERMHEARPDVRYDLVALDDTVKAEFMRGTPGQVCSFLEGHSARYNDGTVKPLPVQTFDMRSETADAMTFMSRAKHIGKVVMSNPAPELDIPSNATYIISGGLGALGVLTAKHLVDLGAQHLLLLSRSGKPAADVEQMWHEVQSIDGIDARPVVCDVADAVCLGDKLGEALAEMPVVRGVIHAAGVLDDRALMEQTAESMKKVFRPKVAGAWNLHELSTQWSQPLDFFVCYSSMSSLLGNAGQANYAAANAAVDGLMRHRQSIGLCGTSIQWGPWAEVGMAARSESVKRKLELAGIGLVSPDVGMGAIDAAVASHVSVCEVAVMPLMDWQSFRAASGHDLVGATQDSSAISDAGAFAVMQRRLKMLPEADRRTMLAAAVLEIAQGCCEDETDAVVLRVDTPLMGAGLDSLSLMEMKGRMRAEFGLEIPNEVLLSLETASAVGNWLAERYEQNVEDSLVSEAINVNNQRGGGWMLHVTPREEQFKTVSPASAQQYAFMSHRISNRYNEVLSLRLYGEAVNIDALGKAFNALVGHHAILRTRLENRADSCVQIIEEPWQVHIDVEALAGNDPREEFSAFAQAPFDHEVLPLFRVALIAASPGCFILGIVFHHSILDGVSCVILLSDLARLYGLYASGRDGKSKLTPPQLEYADFALCQSQWIADEGQLFEDQQEFWKCTLRDCEALSLTDDLPRGRTTSASCATIPVSIPGDIVVGLREICADRNVTMFSALLTLFQILLARYCENRTCFAVATPYHQREGKASNILGCFINMIALRADLHGLPTFYEALDKNRLTVCHAMRHGDLPFFHVVKALGVQHDPTRHPLCQATFNLRDTREGAYNVHMQGIDRIEPWMTSQELVPSSMMSEFDISLVLEKAAPRSDMLGYLIYREDCFYRQTAEGMARSLVSLTKSAIESPCTCIWDIDMLPEATRHHLMTNLSGSLEGCPCEPTFLHQLVEAQALCQREAPALKVYESGQEMSYEELDYFAGRLSTSLQNYGVASEQAVGVLMSGGHVEAIISILGILKAGGVYVPLDPEYPPERLQQICQMADIGIALVKDEADVGLAELLLGNALQVSSVQALLLGREQERFYRSPDKESAQARTPSSTAYIIFTSGSTGEPKGVVVQHSAVVKLVRSASLASGCPLGQGDFVASLNPLTFDASIMCIFRSLCCGACLCLSQKSSNLNELPSVLSGITHIMTTPSLFSLAVDADLPHLVYLELGGEPCPRRIVGLWMGKTRMVIAYGPTECVVASSFFSPSEKGSYDWTRPPIGRPLPGVQMYILDKHMHLVPPGVMGELFIGGMLARGYLKNPKQTKKRFVQSPFDGRTHLFRSGDLARFQPDGNIQFCGRADDQVKIRGLRVELQEVEEALMRIPGVLAACVVKDGENLVGFYTEDGSAPPIAVKQRMKQALPGYMVPPMIIPREALPLNPSGKVDRRTLLASAQDRSGSEMLSPLRLHPEQSGVLYPQNDLERQVLAVLSKGLGQPSLHVDDNFFEFGGNSLLGAQLIVRLRADVPGCQDLNVTDFFERPSCRELCEFLSNNNNSSGAIAEDVNEVEGLVSRRSTPVHCPWWTHIALAMLSVVRLAVLGVGMYPAVALLFYAYSSPSIGIAALRTLLSIVAAPISLCTVSVLAKVVVLWRLKPGKYPIWGQYYIRWWLASGLIQVPHEYILPMFRGTFLSRMWFKLLGANIHHTAHLDSIALHDAELIELHAESQIHQGAVLRPSMVSSDGYLYLGKVTMGRGSAAGTASSIAMVASEEAVALGISLPPLYHLPALASFTTERLNGGNASASHDNIVPLIAPHRPSTAAQALFLLVISFAHVLAFVITVLILGTAALVEGRDGLSPSYVAMAATLAFSLGGTVLLLWMVLSQRIFLAARTHLSGTQVKYWKWTLGRLQRSMFVSHASYFLGMALPQFGTWFMRAMGAMVGDDVFMPMLPITVDYEQISIGNGCVFGGDIYILGCREDQSLPRGDRKVYLGNKVALGHDVILAAPCRIGEGVKLGDYTMCEADEQFAAGTIAIGHPLKVLRSSDVEAGRYGDAVEDWKEEGKAEASVTREALPLRWKVVHFTTSITFHLLPRAITYFSAACIARAVEKLSMSREAGAFFFPDFGGLYHMDINQGAGQALGVWLAGASIPFLYLLKLFVSIGVSVLLKRLLVVSIPPGIADFGSLKSIAQFHWNTVFAVEAEVGGAWMLRGTPLYNAYRRAMGARVGNGAILLDMGSTENDLLRIGDGAVINPGVKMPCHAIASYQMEFIPTTIGEHAEMATRSAALAGANIGPKARVSDLSLVLKGDVVTAGGVWAGLPARRVRASGIEDRHQAA
ncbi:unnamed protein product [Chrysoparadoxa australica]